MRLNYIKNVYWHDGPLLDAFMSENGFDLYLGMVHFENRSDWVFRKVDASVYFDGDGIHYPEDWWTQDVPFFYAKGERTTWDTLVINAEKGKINGDYWNEPLLIAFIEAEPIERTDPRFMEFF